VKMIFSVSPLTAYFCKVPVCYLAFSAQLILIAIRIRPAPLCLPKNFSQSL
jgi:hypothetical protein